MAVNGILGKKVGMTQLFDDKGEVRPVTVLQAGPCVVTQRKGATRDGYEAAQIGLIEFVKESRLTKPMKGHFGKHNLPPVKFMREVTIEAGADGDGTKVGDKVLVDIFDGEKFVDIVGTTKGRGFAGVVKRHHFRGGEGSHGSMFHRAPGSIGASSYPSRVVKGMRMAGHMGADRVTVRNLKVLRVDAENNLLLLEGSVPGGPNSVVLIRKAIAAKPIRVAQVEPTKKKGKK
jgi:large subunit ribosomal protein L3